MALTPATTRAAEYPSTDMRLVVPFPPKGVTDLTARVVAAHLARRWGRAVEVVNVTGDGSNTGVVQVLTSAPDGATMMMTATGAGTPFILTSSHLAAPPTPNARGRAAIRPLG